jgi:transcriptional regulator with XRE-family HTH domain
MPRGRKPASVDYVFNLKKLREFRHRVGLSLQDVREATGILPSNLSEFEHGRIMLQFHKIKLLIELYGLDAFEVLDLLRLRFLDPKLLREFRRACCMWAPPPPRPSMTSCWSLQPRSAMTCEIFPPSYPWRTCSGLPFCFVIQNAGLLSPLSCLVFFDPRFSSSILLIWGP